MTNFDDRGAPGRAKVFGPIVPSVRKAALAGSVAVVALAVGAALVPAAKSTQAFAQAGAVTSVAAPGFADVVETVRPAVVSVRVKQDGGHDRRRGRFGDRRGGDLPEFRDLPDDHPLNRFFRRHGEEPRGEGRRGPRRFGSSQGSGFIISQDGYVVTNNHVVEGDGSISVVMDDGTEHDAELIGADPRTDLAVLKIEAGAGLTYVTFSDATVRVGEWVVTMGNPFGLGGTVTAGIVSARGRDIGAGPYDDFLQIDAAVNRGNSGGPAFSLDGGVIGVNTAIFSPNGGNVGIAFAIPAATAKTIVADLIENGSVTRGWLGVQIQPVTPDIAESLGLGDAGGAIVAEVTGGSPAAAAGIETGDTILSVDGETVAGPKDLARKIARIEPGEDAGLVVWRDGERQAMAVEIGTLSEKKTAALQSDEPESIKRTSLDDLGLELGADDGVIVLEVNPEGEAAAKGVRRGDRIVKVNGESVVNPIDVADGIELAEKAGRKAVLFLIQSGERSRFVALDLKSA